MQEVADNQIDSGDLMECLIQNKHQKEMNEKCVVGVTHFQLVIIRSRLTRPAACCAAYSALISQNLCNVFAVCVYNSDPDERLPLLIQV